MKKDVECINIYFIFELYAIHIGAINSFGGSKVPTYWQQSFFMNHGAKINHHSNPSGTLLSIAQSFQTHRKFLHEKEHKKRERKKGPLLGILRQSHQLSFRRWITREIREKYFIRTRCTPSSLTPVCHHRHRLHRYNITRVPHAPPLYINVPHRRARVPATASYSKNLLKANKAFTYIYTCPLVRTFNYIQGGETIKLTRARAQLSSLPQGSLYTYLGEIYIQARICDSRPRVSFISFSRRRVRGECNTCVWYTHTHGGI